MQGKLPGYASRSTLAYLGFCRRTASLPSIKPYSSISMIAISCKRYNKHPASAAIGPAYMTTTHGTNEDIRSAPTKSCCCSRHSNCSFLGSLQVQVLVSRPLAVVPILHLLQQHGQAHFNHVRASSSRSFLDLIRVLSPAETSYRDPG